MGDGLEKGMITCIRLKNFMTNKKVTVKPERHLNVIEECNGSDKSTIVAAIILGLGGKPNIIGQALHVGEYVKFGCDLATIEIHLKNGTEQDSVVTRIFTREGRSTWLINDNQTDAKNIQDFTSKLNIQVDNLCQFLPQNKVQDFSKMDAQALLENTERCVGDPKLLEYHLKLKEQRIHLKELEVDLADKKRSLKSKTQRRDELQQVVAIIKERKLKQKKAWARYDQQHRKLVENEETGDKNTKLGNIIDDVLSCENEIQSADDTCSRQIQIERTRDQDIKFAQNQISQLENDFALTIDEVGSEESLTEQLETIATSIKEPTKEMNSLFEKNVTLEHKNENNNREIRAVQEELDILNVDVKRLKLLKQRDIDTYKAVLWFKENQDKFSAGIHLPMMLSINVKEASYAKYFETIIPFKVLIAFICEDEKDKTLLLKYLSDQKLKVNVLHSDPIRRISIRSNIPLKNIKKFGFKHYLIDLVEVPSSFIMNYLVSRYHLNNIPIGTNEIENNTSNIPRNLSCYFSEDNMYSVSTSKSRKTSTRKSEIRGNGMLSIVLDKSKQQQLQEKLQNLQEKKNQISIEIKEVEEKIREEAEILDEYNKNKYQQNIQHIQALESRIHIATDNIKQLERDRMSTSDINAPYTEEITSITEKHMLMCEKNQPTLQTYCNDKSNEEIRSKLVSLTSPLFDKNFEITALRNKFTTAEETVKKHNEEVQFLTRTSERLYNEMLTSTNISPQDDVFEALNKAFEILPSTIDEIDNELNNDQANVFCMAENTNTETILQEYEKMQDNIKKLTELVQKQTGVLEEMTREIEKLKQKWLKPLGQLVEKIHINFSSYLFMMNCTGVVTLCHDENVLDFDQYGLKIKVKFGDADELQELTRDLSDGERTMTTTIYMLALQKLSRVPFRCVEINQDMGAVNIRRIFDLLVNIAERPSSSQYFLPTPKLPKLSVTELMTVHNVSNESVRQHVRKQRV